MKHIFFLSLLMLPLSLLGQKENLVNYLWCFEKDFHQTLLVGDTIEVAPFLMDNSPLRFKKNGRFRRIKAPIQMCGNSPKPQRLDNIKGSWSMNNNQLFMVINKKHVGYFILKMDKDSLVLVVEK